MTLILPICLETTEPIINFGCKTKLKLTLEMKISTSRNFFNAYSCTVLCKLKLNHGMYTLKEYSFYCILVDKTVNTATAPAKSTKIRGIL